MGRNVRRSCSLVLALLATAFASSASAQTVNVETFAADEAGFALSLVGALALARGHVDQTIVSGSTLARYQLMYDDPVADDKVPAFLKHRWLATATGAYGSSDGSVTSNERFAHLRWTAMWLKRLGSEVFAQYQFSEFARLQARVLGGVGARVVLYHHDAFRASMGSAYMLEYEQLTAPSGGAVPDSTIAHRWSNFLDIKLALLEIVTIGNTVYVQPRFDDFSDYRLLDELAIDIAITKHLSLGTALTVARDSEPPSGVTPTHTELKQTIKVTF